MLARTTAGRQRAETWQEIFVTLSDELLGHLRGLAADLEVPFEWLVAGIVCDTLERSVEGIPAPRGQIRASQPFFRHDRDLKHRVLT